MDLSLLENFQKLVASSLQSIIEDLKTQFDNQKEELGDRIVDLTIKVKEQEKEITEMREKIEESNFNEDNFTKVSIISNLNKQIKQLQNENEDLRNCLNKNIPLNAALARTSSPSIDVETNDNVEEPVVEDESNVVEEEPPVEESDNEEPEVQEIEHKGKTYFVVEGELYSKKKDGSQGKKVVGKMVNGKPKLNKKKKKEENL
tara:strand:+ start:195 stop:803 length:609 start_codon:yes stop_codon:yes gene_type:complete